MGKVPLQVVTKFEHQARQNLCTLIFLAAFNPVLYECNRIMESCRDSIKATAKQVKTQIQKGANPERAARNIYVKTCDYLDIPDKRIHIQAFVCQSKALSHILQMEMYTMGNRSSPFSPSPLFHSQLVKREKKNTQALPKSAFLWSPPQQKRGSYRKYRFPQAGGSRIAEATGAAFNQTKGAEGVVIPLPSLIQSTSRRWPPFFQQRLPQRKMLMQRVKPFYHLATFYHSS